MILIDELKNYEGQGKMSGAWAHITSDTSEEELVQFALKIGLKKEWKQWSNSGIIHYDLKGKTRWNKAIRMGAKKVSRAEFIVHAIRRERRLT